MTKINARAKGASGEREFCEWLAKNFDIDKPERNLNQVREGGADILCAPFAFEIKRCETVNLQKWWLQVLEAVNNQKGKAFGLEPVVAFRVNGKEWEFLISAKHIGVNGGYIHMPAHVWKKWANRFIDHAKNGTIIHFQSEPVDNTKILDSLKEILDGSQFTIKEP